MPDYRESLTVRELIDLLVYIKSLSGEHGHPPAGGHGSLSPGPRTAGTRKGTDAPAGIRRRLPVLLTAVVLGSDSAGAHAYLVKSLPARRAVVTHPPTAVQLWFNEAIEPKFSSVSVWDAAGQQVDLGDARVEPDDPKRLTVGLKPLARGTYRVRFRVLSVDGHVVETEYPFTLR